MGSNSGMVYKFCITFRDSIWYLEKTLEDVLLVLSCFELDSEMVQKWKTDLVVNEKMKQFQEVTSLIESYFTTIYDSLASDKHSFVRSS